MIKKGVDLSFVLVPFLFRFSPFTRFPPLFCFVALCILSSRFQSSQLDGFHYVSIFCISTTRKSTTKRKCRAQKGGAVRFVIGDGRIGYDRRDVTASFRRNGGEHHGGLVECAGRSVVRETGCSIEGKLNKRLVTKQKIGDVPRAACITKKDRVNQWCDHSN